MNRVQAEIASPVSPSWPKVLVLGAVTLILAWVMLRFTRGADLIAPIWLSSAVVAAVMIRAERSEWPTLLIVTLAAQVMAHIGVGDSLVQSAAVGSIKTLGVALVASAMRFRFGPDVSVGQLRPLFLLLLASAIAALVTGLLTAAYFGLVEGQGGLMLIGQWTIAHALGFFVLTPLILELPRGFRSGTSPARWGERIGILLLIAGVTSLVYSQSLPVQWAILPFLLLAAFRIPACGAAVAVALVTALALAFTLSGRGPVAATPIGPVEQIMLLQAFLVTIAVVILPLSAIVGERNQLLGEITAARDEARAASEAKGNFLATMSHEIRTPMTGVLGMIELLRSDPTPEERERYFDSLKQSATLLMTVLDDVLDFSKLESGNLVLDHVDFSFEQLAQSTINLFGSAASQKGLLLSMHSDCLPGEYVRGDATRIQQVMSNLLSNAIKFTERGRITVLVRSRPWSSGLRSVRVEVVDTGIGISAEHMDHLFEPFVQAESSISRRFGGTGLGLAICRWLVSAMGGDIGVESRVRDGSTFWFELPLEQGLGPEWQPPAISAPTASRSLDILVAEDNPVNQLLIEAILRRLGHRSTIAENGRVAVEMAAGKTFDCILMDMQMPEMDGMAATHAIRSSGGPNADIPIIAVTADVSAERRRFYDTAGLTDFLTKPIDRLALAARLAAIAGPTDVEQAIDPVDITGSFADLPLLDTTNINQLCAAIGSTNFDGLLDLLQVEMAERPAAIRLAVIERDRDRVKREAHSLKGACRSVGAMALGQAAAIVEMAPDFQAMEAALPTLDRQTMLTRRALEELIPRSFPSREAN